MPHKHTANQKMAHWGVLGGCTRKPKKAALTGGIPGVNAYAHHKGPQAQSALLDQQVYFTGIVGIDIAS